MIRNSQSQMNINSIPKIFTQPPMQLNFIHVGITPTLAPIPSTKFSPFIHSPPPSHFRLAPKIRDVSRNFYSSLHSISRQPSRIRSLLISSIVFSFSFSLFDPRSNPCKSVWRTRISLPGEKLYRWHIFKNSRSSLSHDRSTASERPPRSIT